MTYYALKDRESGLYFKDKDISMSLIDQLEFSSEDILKTTTKIDLCIEVCNHIGVEIFNFLDCRYEYSRNCSLEAKSNNLKEFLEKDLVIELLESGESYPIDAEDLTKQSLRYALTKQLPESLYRSNAEEAEIHYGLARAFFAKEYDSDSVYLYRHGFGGESIVDQDHYMVGKLSGYYDEKIIVCNDDIEVWKKIFPKFLLPNEL